MPLDRALGHRAGRAWHEWCSYTDEMTVLRMRLLRLFRTLARLTSRVRGPRPVERPPPRPDPLGELPPPPRYSEIRISIAEPRATTR